MISVTLDPDNDALQVASVTQGNVKIKGKLVSCSEGAGQELVITEAKKKQAIDAGKIGRIVALSSRRNIPAAWTPEILNKIGPIVGDHITATYGFTGPAVGQYMTHVAKDGAR